MPRGSPPKSPKEMASQGTLARLHKAVNAHYHAIAQDFENFDTLKASTVSRDEFRAVCTRHVQILTDEQVRARLVHARPEHGGRAAGSLPRGVESLGQSVVCGFKNI